MREKKNPNSAERLYKFFIYLVLIMLAVSIIIPVAWVFMASIKQNKEFYGNPWTWPGGAAESVRSRGCGARCERSCAGNRAHAHRIPPCGDSRWRACAQWRTHCVPWRQPARIRRAARTQRHRGGHAVGCAVHEAAQHQCRAHLALPESDAVDGAVRRIRTLCDRRGQSGDAWQLESAR